VLTLRVRARVRGRTAATRLTRLAVTPLSVLAPARVAAAPEPGERGVLRYRGAPSVRPGEFVASDIGSATPHGLLVRVDSVRRVGAETAMQTRPASLVEAIPEANITLGAAATARSASASGPRGFSSALRCSGGARGQLNGSMSLSLTPRLHLAWSFLQVRRAEASVTVRGEAAASAAIIGQGRCELDKTEVASWRAPALRFAVGPVPIVVVPTTTLFVKALGEAEGTFEASLKGWMAATSGLRYDGRIHPISSFEQGFAHTATPRAGGSLGGRVIPTVTFLVYGIAGPRFDLSTGLQLDADSTRDPWWTLSAPVELTASLAVPGHDKLNVGPLTVYERSFMLAQAPPAPPPPADSGNADSDGGSGGSGDQPSTQRARIDWDTDDTDVDLHIWDAEGNHAWFGSQDSIPEADLSSDITTGYGPEIFTDHRAPSSRTFTYGLCYYADRGNGPTTVAVTIDDPDGTRRESTHTLEATRSAVLLGASGSEPAYTPPDGWC
jgi:hypothetical protein